MAAIERCDAEASSLGGDAAGAADVERLRAQLDALEASGTSPSSEASPPSAERGELTEPVRRQLEVVRRMRARCELVTERHAALLALLRGLWAQLCAAHAATDDASSAAALAALERLCGEAEGELAVVDRAPTASVVASFGSLGAPRPPVAR